MIYHLSYASDNMSKSLELSRRSALALGRCNAVLQIDIDPVFVETNKHILSQQRGAGYWLWKPYIIHKALQNGRDGEYYVYTDAGVEFVSDIGYIIKKMQLDNLDVFLFGNNYQHRDWCKREVFDALGCKDGHQVQASAMVFKVSDFALQVANEWLSCCQVDHYIDDIVYDSYQYPSFQEHRHDQAILTAVAQAHGIPLHWWPACYNDGAFTYDKGTYTDNYPVIFHHHRKRNNEW